MKFEVFEGETCGGFYGGNIFLSFLPGKLVLKFVTNFHNILHTGVRDDQRNLSPGAQSGSNVA